jgi:hypothetical protein
MFPRGNRAVGTTRGMPRYVTILALAAGAPLLAACGSSSPQSKLVSVAGKQADAIAFSSCMRSHGVPNFPDPSGNGRGGVQIQASRRAGSGQSMSVNGVPVSAPAFQSAMQSCRSHLPNGGKPSSADLARMKQTSLRFAQCMRSHGVPDFPDPQIQSGPGGGVGIRVGGAGVDPSSPAFKAANQTCGPIVDKGGGALQAGP